MQITIKIVNIHSIHRIQQSLNLTRACFSEHMMTNCLSATSVDDVGEILGLVETDNCPAKQNNSITYLYRCSCF